MRITRRGLIAATAAMPLLPGGAARAQGGTLRFGLSSFPPSLQPWANTGTAAATVKLLIHRGLLSYAPDGKLRGELAESWRNESPTSWVFTLRDNALFHNGEKVTAADIKWNIEQIAGERSTAYYRAEMQNVAGIETPDARTVRILTKTPIATLPNWMASYHMMMVSPRSPTGSGVLPVGAGPFMIRAQERGTSIDLVAFDRYYKPGRPKLAGLRLVAYADENLRVSAIRAGDVDLIEYVPWQSMAAIEADERLRLDATNGPFMYLNFNATRPHLGDARVRRAIAHAIKRDDIVKVAFFGRGSALEGLPIAPGSDFHDEALSKGHAYDPDRAKALLREAGLPNGFSTSLLSTAQYGMHKDTAEVVQQHLAAVGIQAELRLPDWATRVNLGNRGQFDIAVMGTATDNNDADGLNSLIDGSLSPSYVRSAGLRIPKLEELMRAGRAEFDTAKRRTIYLEAQRVALQEVPLVGLAWRSQGYAMKKELTGFKAMPGALNFFSGITLEDAAMG
ncbi:ABC transporter substrate-binding protein [Falsiroseomonas selenitidurans]|uniref:Peptide ABC transporter substrate-binding protein n=1 Tax=Falsiroseomonas selenitidurans TaxID=2716335 RepID=A0ABX1E6R0_9PROT|nr:ABC transporter substrate-binding protein [Falsiroseomonas selenitidurans]NKC32874.1 peptide ABC transporter substrate-binding protein [Falsiroseomonas selenitidurans]